MSFILISIGVIIGALLGLNLSSLAFKYFNTQVYINLAIAITGLIAIVINYASIKAQKESRRWEINKKPLLEISTLLNKLIHQTSVDLDISMGCPPEQTPLSNQSIYSKFYIGLANTIENYEPLLDKKIISALKNYRKFNNTNKHKCINGEIENSEAYEKLLEQQKILLKTLNKYIKKYASI